MPKITQEVFDKIHSLKAEMSIRALSRRLGLSTDTVRKVAQGKRGITRAADGSAVNYRNGWHCKRASEAAAVGHG